jgi:hypothetical protein
MYVPVLNSTLLHLPPLRFHCVGECWDRIQDCCELVIHSLLNLIHSRLDLFHCQRDLIHTLLDLIHARLDIINMLDLIHKARSRPQYILYSLKYALCFLAVLKSSGVPTATKATRGHKVYSDDINNMSVVQCK